MERRDFLVGLGLGAMAGVSCVKQVFVNGDCDADKFIVGELPAVPPSLRAKMTDVLTFMRAHGWFDLLQWPSAPSDPMSQDYLIPRPIPRIAGLGDFAGRRGIHPGRPELSLLYHALASRAVTLANASDDAYPTLEQLDTVENLCRRSTCRRRRTATVHRSSTSGWFSHTSIDLQRRRRTAVMPISCFRERASRVLGSIP